MMLQCCSLILLLCTTATAWPTGYILYDLGPHVVTGISESGQILGMAGNPQQAAVFQPGQEPQILGTLEGGTFSRANGGNRRRDVVGYSSTGPFALQTHAFYWSQRDEMTDLGTFGSPQLFSAATASNSTATVSGYADDSLGESIVPVVWVDGAIQELPTLGGLAGFADAINEDGIIVGESQTPEGIWHATRWGFDGQAEDLHPAGDPGASRARDINRRGTIIGIRNMPAGQRGWVWTEGTGMTDLPPLPGHQDSQATGINSMGHIVGSSTPFSDTFPPVPSVAVRWGQGTVVDLETLIINQHVGWKLERPVGISRRGSIAGTGTYLGQRRSWLLVPEPEATKFLKRQNKEDDRGY